MASSYLEHVLSKTEPSSSRYQALQTALENLSNKLIDVGSRAPIANTPVWVTPQVITGGFATGVFLAGGDLLPHETHLAKGLGVTENERFHINMSFLQKEKGLETLKKLLHSKKYRIHVPEEGALLTLVWLMEHGHEQEAFRLADTISPWFSKLRFYPTPAESPAQMKGVSLLTIENLRNELNKACYPHRAQIQLDYHLDTVLPMIEMILSLWMETLHDPQNPPVGEFEKSDKKAKGNVFKVTNGSWPAQIYPDGWNHRAKDVVDRFDKSECKPSNRMRPYRHIIDITRKALKGPSLLQGKEVGFIRYFLAAYNKAHGLPGSEAFHACRQAAQNQLNTLDARSTKFIRQGCESILSTYPQQGEGLSQLDASEMLTQIQEKFPAHWFLPKLEKLLLRTTNFSLEELLAKKLVPSAEVLATVVPSLIAKARGNALLEDADARYLYEQLLYSFSRRRSLLLLNYQSQVKATEIPWIHVIEKYSAKKSQQEEFVSLLRHLVLTTLSTFPHTILPNKFLSAIQPLIKDAGLKIPILEELAADIFMGNFVQKYSDAALISTEYFEGTIYARYYKLDRFYSGSLSQLCEQRRNALSNSFVKGYRLYDTVSNGMVIEQAMIVTSHNLATLVKGLDLEKELLPLIQYSILPRIVTAIVQIDLLYCQKNLYHTTRLRIRKDLAYAWRQMMFFLALLEKAHGPSVVTTFCKGLKSQFGNHSNGCMKKYVYGLISFVQNGTETPMFVGYVKNLDQ